MSASHAESPGFKSRLLQVTSIFLCDMTRFFPTILRKRTFLKKVLAEKESSWRQRCEELDAQLRNALHSSYQVRSNWNSKNSAAAPHYTYFIILSFLQESQVQSMSRLELEREAASLAAVAEMRWGTFRNICMLCVTYCFFS